MKQLSNPPYITVFDRIQIVAGVEYAYNIPANVFELTVNSVSVTADGTDNEYGSTFEIYTNQGEPKTGNRKTIFAGNFQTLRCEKLDQLFFLTNTNTYVEIELSIYA